jgi:hypothetical protein
VAETAAKDTDADELKGEAKMRAMLGQQALKNTPMMILILMTTMALEVTKGAETDMTSNGEPTNREVTVD